MALNEAYGQTDVMHDRKWIIANMAGRRANDPVRLQMEAALASLGQEEARRTQQQQFSAAHGQQLMEFQQRQRESKENQEANRQSRELYQQGLKDTREERTQLAKEAAEGRRSQSLQLAMNDPNLSKEERAAAKTEYVKTLNLPVAPNAAGVQKGAYGPGGAPATPNTAVAPPTGAGAGGPKLSAAGEPAPATGGGEGYAPTGAFGGQGAPQPQTGGKTYVSPQELSPPPGSPPSAFERAFDLKQAVARGEATTGEVPSTAGGGLTPNSITGPAAYDPNTGANVAPNVLGQTVTVGAPDPSVGALAGSKTELLPNGMTKINTPSGGTIVARSKMGPGGTSAAQDYVSGETRKYGYQTPAAGIAAGNPPPKEAGAYPGAPAFVPPTAAFTTGGSQAQPGPAPGPIQAPAPTPEPGKIQIGLAGQKPIDVASIGYTGGASNTAQDVAAMKNAPQGLFGPGSNQAQDLAAARQAQLAMAQKPPPPPPPKKKEES